MGFLAANVGAAIGSQVVGVPFPLTAKGAREYVLAGRSKVTRPIDRNTYVALHQEQVLVMFAPPITSVEPFGIVRYEQGGGMTISCAYPSALASRRVTDFSSVEVRAARPDKGSNGKAGDLFVRQPRGWARWVGSPMHVSKGGLIGPAAPYIPTVPKQEVPKTSWWNVSDIRKLPGMTKQVRHPVTKDQARLESVIIDLNDDHRWTREQIADWLDTLSVDLRFPTERKRNA